MMTSMPPGAITSALCFNKASRDPSSSFTAMRRAWKTWARKVLSLARGVTGFNASTS
jgi:hypothetical protein